ncbi:unnamed protein product [Mucor fragilis]
MGKRNLSSQDKTTGYFMNKKAKVTPAHEDSPMNLDSRSTVQEGCSGAGDLTSTAQGASATGGATPKKVYTKEDLPTKVGRFSVVYPEGSIDKISKAINK